VVEDSEAAYLRGVYQAEPGVADSIKAPNAALVGRKTFDTGHAVSWARREMGLNLAATQTRAIEMAVTQKFSVVTGGPRHW
jgi:hypothetical protein